ncbi:MAG: ATP-binding protein [Lachnospiraceae bacterium]|nr:ATP-binding protein [Lachnospiraceae bacterium]
MEILKVIANLDNLDDVLGFIDSLLEKAGCSPKVQAQMDIAVEEMYVNIVHYAYEGKTGEAQISAQYDEETDEFTVELKDSGIPFDPVAKPDPDVTLSAEERRIGGLGIYMVKKSMDRMTYRREDGYNVLTLVKKLKG